MPTEKMRDEEDAHRIRDSLRRSQLPVIACLGREDISVRDFMDLQVGDVIRLDRNLEDALEVMVKSRPTFYGKPGRCGSRKAIRIIGMVEEENQG